MIKKKAKGKAKTAKAAVKTGTRSRSGKSKKELNPEEVRKEIEQMVQSEAANIAAAVIGEGKKGQVSPMKFLFEMAHIFPKPTDGSQTSTEEECLAKTLLRRMDLPDEPVMRDEEDLPAPTAAKPAAEASEGEETKTVADEEHTEVVLA